MQPFKMLKKCIYGWNEIYTVLINLEKPAAKKKYWSYDPTEKKNVHYQKKCTDNASLSHCWHNPLRNTY